MTPLAELAWLFLRIGATSFGGPAAHIALMQQEVVRKRGWLSAEAFIDALSATNLIPGPNSTELAMHVGHERGGGRGLIVAGVCFILPAAVIVAVLAAGYARYASVPDVGRAFYGVKPVVIAVVAVALWNLGTAVIRTVPAAVVAAAAVILLAAGVHELLVLALSGATMLAIARRDRASLGVMIGMALPAATPAGAPFGLGVLFLTFVKIGSVLFGSGYVLLAFLRADFVQRLGWLTEQQLLDAVAIGQITPGPVFTTATFIGYLLGGPAGAAVATIGIFLPAFLFVALSRPLLGRLRRSEATRALLDGINAGSLAMMAFVLAQLARAAVTDWLTCAIATISVVAIAHYRINVFWLMAGGAAVGWGH